MPNGNGGAQVGLKWLIIAIVIVAAAGLAAWFWQSSRCSAIADQRDQAIRVSADQSAKTVARAISTFGNRQIVAGNWEALQSYADDLVKDKSLAYIAILDPEGVAVVHTNRSFKGSKLGELTETRKMAQASVPVMNLSRQVATVRVGVNVKQQ